MCFSELPVIENPREELEGTHETEGPERCISEEEVKEASKQMRKGKASEPSEVTGEMFGALGQEGVQ